MLTRMPQDNTDIEPRSAQLAIYLIFSSKTWINRRVDSVHFPDLMTITRHMSIDLSVPPIDCIPRIDGHYVIPVAMLQKGDLINFHSEDEGGRDWSLCTHERTRRLEHAMLEEWARKCEYSDISKNSDLLKQILDARPARDVKYFKEIKQQIPRTSKPNYEAFIVLVKMLARNRVIFAQLDDIVQNGSKVERRPEAKLIKLSYDRAVTFDQRLDTEAFDENPRKRPARVFPHHPIRWVKAKTDVRTGLVINAANCSWSRHYHFQLTCPEEVAITTAALYDAQDKCPDGSPKILSSLMHRPLTRCDLYEPETREISSGVRGRVYLEFAPQRRYWMYSAIAITGFSIILLGILAGSLLQPSKVDFRTLSSAGLTGALVAFVGSLITAATHSEDSNFTRLLVRKFRHLVMISALLTGTSTIGAYILLIIGQQTGAKLSALTGIFFLILVMLSQGHTVWRRFVRLYGQRRSVRDAQTSTEKSATLKREAKGFIYCLPLQIKAGYYEHKELKKPSVRDEIGDLVKKMLPDISVDTRSWWVSHSPAPH